MIKFLPTMSAAILALSTSAASAFDLPKAPAILGGGGGSSADASGAQEVVIRDYATSSNKITAAQLELATAFDLKDQAAALQSQAAALGSGATLDKDAIEKQQQISAAASKAIQEKLDANTKLSEEGKKHVINSLSPFAAGVSGAVKMAPDVSAFSTTAKSQLTSASITDKLAVTTKLRAGTYIASELPGYSSRIYDTFKKLMTYSQNNQIPIPADATAALAGLN